MPMQGTLAEAFVDIKANTKGYEKGVSGIKASLGKLGALVGAAFATKKIMEFGWSALQVASDFEEIGSKFNVIFRGMTAEANAMADQFADDFDLASGTARKLLGNTADLLTGFGFTKKEALDLSKRVNVLAGDLASFSNVEGGAESASKRLTSALLGETESAKMLGIKIQQNTKEFRAEVQAMMQAKNLTETQAKAEVILAQAYEQSKNAIGDYARTRDSFANQQRAVQQQWLELKASIGSSMNEMLDAGGIMKWLADKLKVLAEKIKAFKESGNLALLVINIKAQMKKVWIYLKTPFVAIGRFIGSWVFNLVQTFKFLGKTIKNVFKLNFSDIKDDFDELRTSLVNPVADAFDAILEAEKDLNEVEKKRIKEINDEIKNGYKRRAKNAEDEASAVEKDEDRKQKAIKDTIKIMKGSAEDIIDMMQKVVFDKDDIVPSKLKPKIKPEIEKPIGLKKLHDNLQSAAESIKPKIQPKLEMPGTITPTINQPVNVAQTAATAELNQTGILQTLKSIHSTMLEEASILLSIRDNTVRQPVVV